MGTSATRGAKAPKSHSAEWRLRARPEDGHRAGYRATQMKGLRKLILPRSVESYHESLLFGNRRDPVGRAEHRTFTAQAANLSHSDVSLSMAK